MRALIVRGTGDTLSWLFPILAVLVGFVVLVWAADRFVLGSAAVARNLGVSPLVIGLTIVGFGTSAPEFLVSLMAALTGSSSLCVGNAIGSNITNITLVLGAAALTAPMTVVGSVLRRELPVLIGCMLLATGLMLDGHLGRWDGWILVVALVVMMGWVVWLGMRSENPDETNEEQPDRIGSGMAVFWIVVGLGLLMASSRALVWGATTLAHRMGVSELVIGLSVVAVGTSLPELAASVMAARRGEHEIAVGNVVGSNMFNVLGVLALPGILAPGEVEPVVLRRDLPVMFITTLAFFLMTRFFLRPSHISRVEGAILVGCFVAYIASVYLMT
ncbi:MAG: calcium/sodium antiporter [Sandaracinaceae bacterium]